MQNIGPIGLHHVSWTWRKNNSRRKCSVQFSASVARVWRYKNLIITIIITWSYVDHWLKTETQTIGTVAALNAVDTHN